MLKLNLKKAPRRLELAQGVWIEVLPVTMPVVMRARQSDEVRELPGGLVPPAGAEDPGASGEEALAELDGETRQALAIAIAKGVARQVIVAWGGVLDDDDKPAPVAADYIDALLDMPVVFERFQSEVLAPAMLLASEKNGSALSLTGTSAGATGSAKRARQSARSAPTKSTGRKRSRAP